VEELREGEDTFLQGFDMGEEPGDNELVLAVKLRNKRFNKKQK
jgi:hypothetical protein